MSWDDEDFDIQTSSAPTASWEDEVVDDDPVLESWDIDSDEEREKEKAKKLELNAKKAEQKAKLDAKKKGKDKTLLEIDLVDEKTRKEMLKQAELNADLNHAADLFDGLGVADHPRARANNNNNNLNNNAVLKLNADTPLTAHPLFNPTTKQDFEKLRKSLGSTLKQLAEQSSLFYANGLAVDLARDVCEPLNVEQLRKVVSTLNAMVTQKVKDERNNRLKKTGGTSLGGAGKKKVKTAQVNTGPASFKKDNLDDFMGGDDDGLSDDDFM
jgi:translation initiation factor 3 subunit J